MSFDKKTVKDIDLSGKTVLLRTDYNVELKDNKVIDDYRLRMTLPTIEYLVSQGSKVVVLSHIGRPAGKKDLNLSMMPVATKLSDLLHLPVKFIPDITNRSAKTQVANTPSGVVIVLENLRFWPGEEANDEQFAKKLAEFGDIFVQDGFAVAYRDHASVTGITKFIPSVAGLLLQKEMNNLTNKLEEPSHPVNLIIGGQKVADKLPVIEHFLPKADFIAVGGVVANTFLAASGVGIGKSTIDTDCIDKAKDILQKAHQKSLKEQFTFYLPKDVVTASSEKIVGPLKVVDISQHTWADIISYPKLPKSDTYEVGKSQKILDIGPMSAATIAGALKLSKTAVWCGPLGAVEAAGFNQAQAPFSHSSQIVAEALVGEHAGQQNKAYSIAGGGNTVTMLNKLGLSERFDFLSTGGGACLMVLSGQKLIGVEALSDKDG